MQIAKQEVKNYEIAYSALNKELKKGIISQDEYNEQLYDLRKDQLDAVQSVKKYRDAILDLVKDGIEKETEAFEKLITARQDNLKKQKEADDYARNIRDKTKDINAIEAQIAALSGDESLATRAQIRDLEAKLQEAQQDLDDTRRDHEYDTMSQAYDKELEDFKKIQDEKINDLETYLASQKTAINDALTFIRDDYKNTYDRMSSIARTYGITLNNSILNPWTSAAKAVKAYNNAVSNVKSANVKIKTNNFKGQAKSKKARGTFNASQGLTLTDEEGLEAILTKDGVLRQLDSGDTVFNAQQREMLWKISKMSPSSLIKKPNIAANINSGKGMNGDININYDITVEGNADNNTVADIEDICKRAAEYTKSDMIKSFRKIGIAM
jgi:cell division protein FtsL